GRLLRTWRAGRAHLDAYLEDYAFFAEALVDLYEAGGEARYLEGAVALAERIRQDFAAEEGGFFSTARGHEPLIVRPREGHDGAIGRTGSSPSTSRRRAGRARRCCAASPSSAAAPRSTSAEATPVSVR